LLQQQIQTKDDKQIESQCGKKRKSEVENPNESTLKKQKTSHLNIDENKRALQEENQALWEIKDRLKKIDINDLKFVFNKRTNTFLSKEDKC
jgi:succinate dehydrogenase/fumarate reductase flavoprotein subunit